MTDVPVNLPYDNKLARMRKRLQGLQRVAAAINDLYIYGVYPSNYPNLSTVLEQAKDHTKAIIKETKKEIALFDDPMDQYDLKDNEQIEEVK
tara:strand:+ start:345 stop:620 length:276 start_codon:yes stop_codon:yes gene_type:complete